MKYAEEFAMVLDFLPHGHLSEERRIPVAQVIGEKHFSLLEVIPKKGVFLVPGQRVYIGDEKREEVHHVKGRVKVRELTHTARAELERVIGEIVDTNVQDYINFFNRAIPITTRLHQLELLPGIGKKHMWKIIEERRYEVFKDFDDLKGRVELLPDPRQAIIKRIVEELDDTDKYKLFTS